MAQGIDVNQIIGNPNSATSRLLKTRRTPGEAPLETGVWYSNFTRVREEAERRGLPLVAMWTNGELCGFCRRFTGNVLESAFVDWMKTSGCLFWLGGSMDQNGEDGRGGAGFVWCRGPKADVSYFPFFSVCQRVHGEIRHAFYGSGHDYDERLSAPEGASHVIAKLSAVLAAAENAPSSETVAQKPEPAPVKPVVRPSSRPTTPLLHIRFNPDWDAEHIARFQNALREHGGHCPCRAEKTADSLCMCKWFLEQNTPGRCHCGAFEKYRV